jgi:hypothetical protein
VGGKVKKLLSLTIFWRKKIYAKILTIFWREKNLCQNFDHFLAKKFYAKILTIFCQKNFYAKILTIFCQKIFYAKILTIFWQRNFYAKILTPGLRERGDRSAAAVAVAASGHRGAGRGHQVEGQARHHRVHAAAGRWTLLIMTIFLTQLGVDVMITNFSYFADFWQKKSCCFS